MTFHKPNFGLSERHGASSACGWRRRTPDIEDRY